ncbi:glycosyltransferase family 4 protein, partial [Candidatus Dojkabacteria bacterium]|nr:glycosyltransferase family 4 protein [Candidatus Dojkabacteria bacterium]
MKKHILLALHQYIDDSEAGGVEKHVEDLKNELVKDFKVSIIYTSKDCNSLMLRTYEDKSEQIYSFPLKEKLYKFTQTNEELSNLIKKLVSSIKVDTIHVHHTLYVGFDIFQVAKELEIPLTYTIHDYYLISPDFNQNYKFIDGEYVEDKTENNKYFAELTNNKSFRLKDWQDYSKKILKLADSITVPSETVKKEILKVFDVSSINVISLGLPLSKKQSLNKYSINTICFFGSTHYPNKGRHIIENVSLALLEKNKRIKIQFLGTKAEAWPSLEEQERVNFLGKYKRKNVISKLQEANPAFIVFLSLSKETFSFTLSEAWLAGIPVIVGPIGAQAERVEKNRGGIILESFEQEEIIKKITELLKNKEELLKLRKEVKKIPGLSIKETLESYKKLYKYSKKPSTVDIDINDFLAQAQNTYPQFEKYSKTISLQKELFESHIRILDNHIENLNKFINEAKPELEKYRSLKGKINWIIKPIRR